MSCYREPPFSLECKELLGTGHEKSRLTKRFPAMKELQSSSGLRFQNIKQIKNKDSTLFLLLTYEHTLY